MNIKNFLVKFVVLKQFELITFQNKKLNNTEGNHKVMSVYIYINMLDFYLYIKGTNLVNKN